MEIFYKITLLFSLFFPFLASFFNAKKYNVLHGIITFYSFCFIIISGYYIISTWMNTFGLSGIEVFNSAVLIDDHTEYTTIQLYKNLILDPLYDLFGDSKNKIISEIFSTSGSHMLLLFSLFIFIVSQSVSSIFSSRRRSKLLALKIRAGRRR